MKRVYVVLIDRNEIYGVYSSKKAANIAVKKSLLEPSVITIEDYPVWGSKDQEGENT